MRVLLVHPKGFSRPLGFQSKPEPLALELLAGMVPDHEVAILDMRLDGDLDGMLLDFRPDVVGVTALTTEAFAALSVLENVKNYAKEIFTIAGGIHATLVPESFCMPCVDAVCLGEGELVFSPLIEALALDRRLDDIPNLIWQNHEGEFIHNGRSDPEKNMDSVPLPRRDLTERYHNKYLSAFGGPASWVTTSRGCPYRCSFCSVWQFYQGRTCQMSPEQVMENIRAVKTNRVNFADDNFMMNARRENSIADRLRPEGVAHQYFMQCRADSIVQHPGLVEKWANLGLNAVLLGLEAATDEMLENVHKRSNLRINNEAIRILQANGVLVWGAFIVDPNWLADDFASLRDYVVEKGITITQYTILTPLPGTRLYREKHHELLTNDYNCFDTLHAIVPTRLPREEFYRQFAALYSLDLGWEHYYDMLSQGQVNIDDVRRGHKFHKTMSNWEIYAEGDPILGQS